MKQSEQFRWMLASEFVAVGVALLAYGTERGNRAGVALCVLALLVRP